MLEYILTNRITSLARRDEDGASAVEYGLLVAGIAALIVAIVFLFGGIIKGAFTDTCGAVSSEGTAGATCELTHRVTSPAGHVTRTPTGSPAFAARHRRARPGRRQHVRVVERPDVLHD